MSVRCSSLDILACLTFNVAASSSCVRLRAARSSSSGMSRSIRAVSDSLCAWASGDMRSRNSLKFRTFGISILLFQFFQVLIVEPVCDGDENLVPTAIAGFVAADQQESISVWIERIENPVWTPFMLNPQLPHMPMAASSDLRAIRMTQCDTLQFQKAYRRIHADLFGLAQFIP